MDKLSKSINELEDEGKSWKAPVADVDSVSSSILHGSDSTIGSFTKSNSYINTPISQQKTNNLPSNKPFQSATSVPNFSEKYENLIRNDHKQTKPQRRFIVIPANAAVATSPTTKKRSSSKINSQPFDLNQAASSQKLQQQYPQQELHSTNIILPPPQEFLHDDNSTPTLIVTQSPQFVANNEFTSNNNFSVINSGKPDSNQQYKSLQNNKNHHDHNLKASFILGEDDIIGGGIRGITSCSFNDYNVVVAATDENEKYNEYISDKNQQLLLSDKNHRENKNCRNTNNISPESQAIKNFNSSSIDSQTNNNFITKNNNNNNNDDSYPSQTTILSQVIGDNLNVSIPVNLRLKPQTSSMRSVVSAYLSPEQQHDQRQQMSLQSPKQERIIRTSSYIFNGSPGKAQSHQYYCPSAQNVASGSSQTFQNPTKIYSDATSIRSLASIGVGSTDGRKLVIRRVPNSPEELLNIVTPPPRLPPGYDEDDDDSYDNSDSHSNMKPRRQYWANKMQFVLACIGYSVGLGNVWRFPYICYKSGGGAFLIPYFIILIICSTPMLYMELAIGQYTGRGPIGALGQICPLFKGAGVASVVISFLMSTYYSVIIAYSIYYFFTSMKPEMPWINCSNRWNTINCWVPERKNVNITPSDISRSPAEEFFENKVLQISPGIEFPGTMRWELFACLICAWLLVYFATWKSIKSSAKVRYFTATFPFLLIIVLMGRALTLDGSAEGLRYFFRPKWSDLGNANIWINAASQNFMSLGIAFGSMISFASYNKYNNYILYDTLAVSGVNAITSLLVGVFAFATLGNLAFEQGTSVRDVISDGPGFIFVVYPQVMAKMPYAQLWAVMFFFMLLLLGLNSQFAIVEVVVTSIQDGFPNWIKKTLGYHEILVLLVCVVSFLFGLPNIIQGGIYFFQLMDHYAASISIMFLAFFQMVAIAWFYGSSRLSNNVKQMTGKTPAWYLKTCWVLCGPALLVSLWIFSLINYREPTYHNGRYVYPEWAYGIGWAIASVSLVCIPAYAAINISRASGKNFFEKLMNSIKPNIYECRICGEHHCEHDFPEDQYILQQQDLPVIQPKIILKAPPSGHPQKYQMQTQYSSEKKKPLLTNKNQPNTSVVEDESTSGQIQDEEPSKT